MIPVLQEDIAIVRNLAFKKVYSDDFVKLVLSILQSIVTEAACDNSTSLERKCSIVKVALEKPCQVGIYKTVEKGVSHESIAPTVLYWEVC